MNQPTHVNPAEIVARYRRPRSSTFRKIRDNAVIASLVGCGVFTVFITFSIIFVLFEESMKFFGIEKVSFIEFFTSARWEPLLGEEQHFGVWSLVGGTLLVTVIAAAIALPAGLITAIYLSEYAPSRVRAVLKPVLEVLAGIPTVVYGFFALTVITPSLQFLHDGFNTYNAAGAGIAVGIMCLPIVCSLSEDAIRAVPSSLREGAYALGGTRFDVSVKVVVPAGLSGIVAAFLLAIARAVGETMIVALAAGGLAQLTADPRAEVQTMTAYMVQIFLGDVSSLGVEYYSSYAVAATLFIMTLILTLIGNLILRKFREVYE